MERRKEGRNGKKGREEKGMTMDGKKEGRKEWQEEKKNE